MKVKVYTILTESEYEAFEKGFTLVVPAIVEKRYEGDVIDFDNRKVVLRNQDAEGNE